MTPADMASGVAAAINADGLGSTVTLYLVGGDIQVRGPDHILEIITFSGSYSESDRLALSASLADIGLRGKLRS